MRFFLLGPRIGWFRPGISFGHRELTQAIKPRTARSTGGGAFLYVIQMRGLCKIGVSQVPFSRMAQLQTASPDKLKLAYSAVTPGDGYDIEAMAHSMLDPYHVNGEWFREQPEMAVAALAGAAFKLEQPLAQLTEDQSRRTVAIARSGQYVAATRQPGTLRHILPHFVFGLIAAIMLWNWLVGH
jgi:Meiotically up-regulated gene 113